MDIAIVDERRYGKQKRYYVLRPEAISDDFLPDPSPTNWREVKREDFVSKSTAVFVKRSEK